MKEKQHEQHVGNILPYSRQIIRIMRLSLFFLVVGTAMAFSAATYSQSTKLSLDLKNATVGEVINTIERQSEYLFLYQEGQVDLDRHISIEVKGRLLKEILDEMFRGTDNIYIISGRQVVIGKAPRKALEAQLAAIQKDLKTTIEQPQQREIKGKVTDNAGEPLPGATVMIKGTTTGTITDADGNFTLRIPANAQTLQISFVGMKTQEVPIRGANTINIALAEEAIGLQEVVAVGYGTMKKSDLTGSVASVQGAALSSRKTAQLSTALQGAIPGLMVTRNNNAPGATATIRVRGVTTIGNTEPLVIVDGVPGDINQVNANDVESISVLKDAASASIYGSRAAAGVILVTTKRAKQDDLLLNYNFEYGYEIPTKQPEYVGIQRFLEMTNELRYNDNNAGGWYQAYSEDQVNNWVRYHETDPDNYPITDWTDLILKKSAPRYTHSLNLSGGTKVVKSKASFNYDKIDGLYSDLYYERFMLRSNNDFTFNKYLGATLDFNFKRTKRHGPIFDPINRMRIAAPVYAAVWKDGRIAEGKSGSNPYAIMKEGGKSDSWYNQIGGKASIDITPISDLKFSVIIAPTYNFDKTKSFSLKIPYYLASDPQILGGYMEGHTTTKLSEYRNDYYDITSQLLINYNKNFGAHSINLMGGYENYYSFYEGLSASRDQYELDSYPYLDLGPLEYRDNSGNAYETAYRSFFARVMYNYANKYLLQTNIRYDGSSRFAEEYRWGSFPSFSGGWVMTEEGFIKDKSPDWLTFLKLRASWGSLGNERIGNYPYQAVINFSNALFYKNGQAVSELTAAQWQYVIENISWEKTESFDFGLDATFLNNKLRFTGDYYYKTTKDMLLALEIPDYVGFDNPDKNTGKMFTRGYDLELGWNNKIGDFSYSIGVNFSDFISKMGDLGGTEFLGDQVKKKGSEFNEWYGYLSDGLFLSEGDLNNSPKLNANTKIGDIKYKDVSGPEGMPDGKVSPEYDRVLLGGSLPRYMFGGNFQMEYKNMDLSFVIQGVGKQLVRMSREMIEPLRENWGNIPAILDGNYWSSKLSEEENAKMKYPRLTRSNIESNMVMSDFWLFNGRYARLKNITVGYLFNPSITKKINVNTLRLYFSANDLLSISKFPKGWDPEMGASSYPITTSLLFGVSINF